MDNTLINPDISIIVPVYNVEKYLCQCLDSLLAQDFDNWEAIIVDDGSTDSSGAICDRYAVKDNRFHVLHTPNRGVGDARNEALKHAKGNYIGFLDPDDWIEPDYFSSLINIAGATKCDIAIGGLLYEHVGHTFPMKTKFRRIYNSVEMASLLCEDRMFHSYMWNKVFSHKLISFNPEGIRAFEDMSNILCWILKSNWIVCCYDIDGYHYRQRQSSIVGNKGLEKLKGYYDAVRTRNRQFREMVPMSDITPSIASNIIKGNMRVAKSIARGNLVADIDIVPKRTMEDMIKSLLADSRIYLRWAMKHSGFSLSKECLYYCLGRIAPNLLISCANLTKMFHTSRKSEVPKELSKSYFTPKFLHSSSKKFPDSAPLAPYNKTVRPDQHKSPMDIVCNIDEHYVPYCGIMLTSLLDNNRDSRVAIHIIAATLSDEGVKLLRHIVEDTYGQQLRLYLVGDELIRKLPHSDNGDIPMCDNSYISLSTYFRCFLSQILPDDIHKVIYLDCDLLILGSLKPLWNTDISNYALAAVEDMNSAFTATLERLCLPLSYIIFNAGVLLINLDYWREYHVTQRLMKWINANRSRIVAHDQDLLNAVLYKEMIHLSHRWNMQEGMLRRRRHTSPSSDSAIDSEIPNTVIVHFAGRHKPWHENCLNPYKSLWEYYTDLSPWKGMRPKRHIGFMLNSITFPFQDMLGLRNGYRHIQIPKRCGSHVCTLL